MGREGAVLLLRRDRLSVLVLAQHLDVATHGHRREGVLGLAPPAREDHGTEADREAQHAHADPLCHREVSEFVDEYEDTESHGKGEHGEGNGWDRDRHRTLRRAGTPRNSR